MAGSHSHTDTLIVPANATGKVLQLTEGLSFWGGTDPKTGNIIDAHHPQAGCSLAGRVVLMPTTRGSCSGSGGLLELALNGVAPAVLIFNEPEDIVTVGAFVATQMFDLPIGVVRLDEDSYTEVARANEMTLSGKTLCADGKNFALGQLSVDGLNLSQSDQDMLDGKQGVPSQIAMQMIQTIAAVQDADELTDVTRVHIDGCIYGGGANLGFAEKMADIGARIRVPTTMNAISVDHAHWRDQEVPPTFGQPAQRLADAYLRMGAKPTFTCAPYFSENAPQQGEEIGWSESNAVIYANSVLGARTAKHPDYLDLFVALTGRAPKSGVYLDAHRRPSIILDVSLPEAFDDAIWPLMGWLIGQASPAQIPLVHGLEGSDLSKDDLRAICAAFGTTSGAPMLHIAGVTPEADLPPLEGSERKTIGIDALRRAWRAFNTGSDDVDLIALGSPHFSLTETRKFCEYLGDAKCNDGVKTIVTLGRETLNLAQEEGLLKRLEASGVRVLQDVCWCSLTEPLFPSDTKTVMTNSGKYAHYEPGLHGRSIRFGGLAACAQTAKAGISANVMPDWLMQ